MKRITCPKRYAEKGYIRETAQTPSAEPLVTMARPLLVIFYFALLSADNLSAQQNGEYLTKDQSKKIQFLDSNRIILTEEVFKDFNNIKVEGKYKRKFRKIIVYPSSITNSDGSDILAPLPKEIEYKIKGVTGQKFQLRKLSESTKFDKYYLRQTLTFGIP